MKVIPIALQNHLDSGGTELCYCWHIERKDGTVWGYTTHDVDIYIPYFSLTFKARNGFTATAIETKEGLNVDNLDVNALSLTAEFTESEILSGKWDNAKVHVFRVCWSNPSLGILWHRVGTLGEFEFVAKGASNTATGYYKVELRGMMQPLQQQVLEVISPLCRANVGDARCTVNLAAYTSAHVVSTVAAPALPTGGNAQRLISATTLTQADGYFAYGKITFDTGANAGLSMEVKSFSAQQLNLFQPMPNSVQVGDQFTVHAGCDHKLNTCATKFNNAINFVGEPHLPGQDKIMQPGR